MDFLNTRPVLEGKPVELLTDFAALLRWFQAADVLNPQQFNHLLRTSGGTTKAHKTTESMWELRESLRKEISAWERGEALSLSTIANLNTMMAAHPVRTRLTAHPSAYTTDLWFELREPEGLFAPLAYSAVRLFTEADPKRVRKCDQCVLHFHDTSKKGTRRWCSMQLCGNRLKVAAYAARRRRHA